MTTENILKLMKDYYRKEWFKLIETDNAYREKVEGELAEAGLTLSDLKDFCNSDTN